MILEEVGRPLVGLTPHEPVEILEAQYRGPLIERTGRAVLIGRSVVILAKPRVRITVILNNIADASDLYPDDRVVSRITRRAFPDYPRPHTMLSAAGYLLR